VTLSLPRGGEIRMGRGHSLFLIAGPCVVEGREKTLTIARILREVCGELGVPLIFKASYDKANRSSGASFRGRGVEEGLDILAEVKATHHLPLLSDVHESVQVERAAQTLDVLQVPAFLSRQTDLLRACAKTGRVVNVKKGQFLAPEDMANVAAKVEEAGGTRILLTERGVSFGYHTLVTDLRAFPIMAQTGWPVVFDGTHSVQRPGGLGTSSGGDREMIPYLVRGAIACGVDGLFLECHDDPDHALSDGPNNLDLKDLPKLLSDVLAIRRALGQT
jgi:2-dehydro-3-deoxyphosphooctonate aldolase (KDO 8-P synthase)